MRASLAAVSTLGLALAALGRRGWLVLPLAVAGLQLERAWRPRPAPPGGPDPTPARDVLPDRFTERLRIWRQARETDRLPIVRSRRRWGRHWLWIVPLAIVVLAVGFRLALTPIAARFARSALASMNGYEGDFRDLAIKLWGLKFTVSDLVIDKELDADATTPFLQVKTAEVDIQGRQLLRGRMVAEFRLLEPRVHMVLPVKRDAPEEPAPPEPTEIPDVSEELAKAIPFRLDRFEIRQGEMALIDPNLAARPEIRVGEIEATLENIETGTQLGNGRPTVFAARAKLQSTGRMTLFYTADLLARDITFAGQMELRALKLSDLNPFIVTETGGLRIESGEFDLFTVFAAGSGRLTGGVKPMLKNVDTAPANDALLTGLKSALADAAVSIFSDRVPHRNAIAGIIPIGGELSAPGASVFPTILSILRNAFVEGLAAGFAHLPPRPAPAVKP